MLAQGLSTRHKHVETKQRATEQLLDQWRNQKNIGPALMA